MRAPEFPTDAIWLNTKESLSLKKLRGHIVLIDFWTYCCINCVHVLQELSDLEKYRGEPFIVIGVHTAKFTNEQDPANIAQAIARYEIKHPIIVDSSNRIRDEYTVKAWPTLYLLGADGKIIDQWVGEGHQHDIDQAIAQSLKEARQQNRLSRQKVKITRTFPPRSTLSFPGKITFHPNNEHLFVSDTNHHRILELEFLDKDKAQVVQVIGKGKKGRRDSSFQMSTFNRPHGLEATDQYLYVCDTGNHLIRQIDLIHQQVHTIAGTGTKAPFGEKGGNALQTPLSSPWDLAISGNHCYIAMAGSHQVWDLNLENQELHALTGSGWEGLTDGPSLEAHLAQPSGISIDAKHLYFVDSESSALRRYSFKTKELSTLIGTGLFSFGLVDGPFSNSLMQHPVGIDLVDHEIYIADTYNHSIRVVNLQSKEVHTLISRKQSDVCQIEDEDCLILPLYEPSDVTVHQGKLYIADTNNHLIRIFDLTTKDFSTVEIYMDKESACFPC
ncbi:thioredoxin-like domain-containing protein [Hazenella coriacea]|uniref:Thiol-disulfide isomerase/thioredoxin n=1 Tax=Hazenella coriacea TaxID=1179467 RepID=A0A4R3LA54_9BACL|nr:thioredoxin-like domain-containing protein [Hazenella coriacea]TCS96713.1 thiol-disulfide isomerase/thioredoxin [Hazenella coriacea]